jgi:hypothetical protein
VIAVIYFLQGGVLDTVIGFMKRATGQMDRHQLELKQYLLIVAQRDEVLKEAQAYADYFTETGKDAKTDQETESANLLSEIEELARNGNVTVTSLTPKEIKEADVTREYRVELSTQSSQKDLISFLYALQSAQSIFYPEKLQITATRVQEASMVTAQMTLVKAIVYSRK